METRIDELTRMIAECRENIDRLENEISEKTEEIELFDVSDHYSEDDFAEQIDMDHGMIEVGGLEYAYSDVWKSVDPIAFEQAYSECTANMDPNDIDEYCDLVEELNELENDLNDEEYDLTEYESELEELEESE